MTFQKEITKWLKSKKKSLKFSLISPDKLFEAAEDAGIELKDGYDTNGWQWDYFRYGKLDNKYFFLYGSAYYGNAEISYCSKEDYEYKQEWE